MWTLGSLSTRGLDLALIPLRAEAEIAVVGAGVVGSACALELARRGASVVLLEAEPEPGLKASGTNSGILHVGFDSPPGELETELILRSAAIRQPVLDALAIPAMRCGAEMRPLGEGDAAAIDALVANASVTGAEVRLGQDGVLAIPDESITDPVAFTLGLAAAAQRHGCELRTGFRVGAVDVVSGGLTLREPGGGRLTAGVAVNCAGLGASEVAGLAGDDSFEVFPRKGEFLVFDPIPDAPLERILLPVPTKRTKGVLVFPTIDGKVVAGPTAVDQDDPRDWSVRPQASEEILPKAAAMFPPLAGAEPIFAYAGLRPAGRGVNYLIGVSAACPALVNVAAIRSTGLTASLGIAEHVGELVAGLGVRLRSPDPLARSATAVSSNRPWWRRTAEHLVR